MKVAVLRSRLGAALEAAMRNREAEAVALTADRTKAMAVAVAGMAEDDEVDVDGLEIGTGRAAVILGFHPEHVRRLIRTGRVRARRVGGDYRLRLSDLWPLIEARYREPGRRRLRQRRP